MGRAPAYECRLTVVAGRGFAAEIHAGSAAARVDWRRDYDSLAHRGGRHPEHALGQGVFGVDAVWTRHHRSAWSGSREASSTGAGAAISGALP